MEPGATVLMLLDVRSHAIPHRHFQPVGAAAAAVSSQRLLLTAEH